MIDRARASQWARRLAVSGICLLAGAAWPPALAAGAESAAAASAAAPAAMSASTASAAMANGTTHRPLRSNQPLQPLEPTEPQVFTRLPGAPALQVEPRVPHLALYPCSQCHKVLPLNAQPRKLVGAPHPAALRHGDGRLWCLDCHLGSDRDRLRTIAGAPVEFNDSPRVCGQCHSARYRDWAFGAHGKRLANWQGERRVYACTHCHDPHLPALQARAPGPPPPVRAGLKAMAQPASDGHGVGPRPGRGLGLDGSQPASRPAAQVSTQPTP